MRVLVAGATGAMGNQLVPRLVEAGHEVFAMIRGESGGAAAERLGAVPVIADALDRAQVEAAVRQAAPEVIVHQLTAIGHIDTRHFERTQLSAAELYLGRFKESAAAAAEGLRIAEDTGQAHRLAHQHGLLAWLAAVRGDERRCRDHAERNLAHFATERIATSAGWGVWALAMLDLGLGRWAEALDRLGTAARGPIGRQAAAVFFAADEVEAAVRLGRPDAAAGAFERFRRWADAADVAWPRAVLARCAALLALDGDPEADFEIAVSCGDRPFEQARSALLYGEWLRRARRKSDARVQLRHAAEAFGHLGAGLWAERARAELRAAGETAAAREGVTDLAAQLTGQELQVVRLAATGATNKEIAAKLFLSPKTVSHHLYRAFPKLGVSTRTELARLQFA